MSIEERLKQARGDAIRNGYLGHQAAGERSRIRHAAMLQEKQLMTQRDELAGQLERRPDDELQNRYNSVLRDLARLQELWPDL
jgi:DUF1680 family protein